MQRLYAGVTWRRDNGIYLTFDDGPIPEITPRILEILRQKQVKATFFVVGDNVRKHPELLPQILADGHRVGNHTFHHLQGLHCSLETYMQDVAACEQLTGSRLFRPPHGRMRSSQKQAILDAGYEVVLWDVLTHDYNRRFSPEKMLAIVRRYSRQGAIVVFHDSLKSGERMLQTLPRAIDWWLAQGYELKTLP